MIRKLLAATALALLAGGIAYGQGQSASGMMASGYQMTATDALASKLIGSPIYSSTALNTGAPANPSATTPGTTSTPGGPGTATGANGGPANSNTDTNAQQIGTIRDLVLDTSGNVKAVVIGIGGVLGLGEKSVAVGYNDVRWQVAQDGSVRGMIDTTADALKSAPDFKYPASNAAAVAAPGANGQTPPQNGAAPAEPTAFDPQTFVNNAAPSNTFEIQTSQQALQKTQNKDITDFANKMVADHTKAGQDLEAAAKAQNLTIPTGVANAQQQQVVQLQNLNGQQFEQAYVQMQVQAHDDAVSLFQSYAQSGPNGPLKDFVTKTLPVLQQHQQMIHKIAGK